MVRGVSVTGFLTVVCIKFCSISVQFCKSAALKRKEDPEVVRWLWAVAGNVDAAVRVCPAAHVSCPCSWPLTLINPHQETPKHTQLRLFCGRTIFEVLTSTWISIILLSNADEINVRLTQMRRRRRLVVCVVASEAENEERLSCLLDLRACGHR